MRNMKLSIITLLCALSLAAFLNGCGSSSREGSGTPAQVGRVGDSACTQCHSAVIDPLTRESIISQYAKSAHNTDALGCEGCHGGGAQHNGIGPIAYPRPDAARCATCHNGTIARATNSAEYVNSNHALLDLHYSATSASPVCLRCHSHEGAVLYNQLGITGDLAFLTAATTTSQLTLDRDGTKFQAINCQTCHEHGGALRAQKAQDAAGNVISWDPNKNNKADQFDLCTSCHTYVANDGTTILASATAGQAAFFHNNRWTRMIASTHYDNPATGVGLESTLIEGYVIRAKGENPCFDCHGHEAKAATGSATESTIHTDWAKSAHAGGLLNQKLDAVAANPTRNDAQVDAVMAAGVNGTTGPAWEHYDWDSVGRQGCQKCHTTTGIVNYLTDPANYSTKKNDFSYLKGWVGTKNSSGEFTAATVSTQNELLYCWGCHTNAGTGAIRNPVAAGKVTGIPAEYKFEGGTTNGIFPDVSSSNICLACHGGRAGGMNIKALTDAQITVARSFTNSHYLGAGATIFKAIGYEYAGRTYVNSSGYEHDKLGTSAVPGTGTGGPCVSCHMGNGSAKADHKFRLAGFGGGTCGNNGACHTDLTQTELDEEKEHYETALFALSALLKEKGFTWTPNSPYFAATNNYTVWTTGTVTAEQGRQILGAAFNANYLLHEPGGYAHNRYYSKRLIIDSIDFVYNGVLEALTEVTANNRTYYNGSDAAAAIQHAVGLTYADHDGVVQTFSQAQADAVLSYLDGTSGLAGFQRR